MNTKQAGQTPQDDATLRREHRELIVGGQLATRRLDMFPKGFHGKPVPAIRSKEARHLAALAASNAIHEIA